MALCEGSNIQRDGKSVNNLILLAKKMHKQFYIAIYNGNSNNNINDIM